MANEVKSEVVWVNPKFRHLFDEDANIPVEDEKNFFSPLATQSRKVLYRFGGITDPWDTKVQEAIEKQAADWKVPKKDLWVNYHIDKLQNRLDLTLEHVDAMVPVKHE